eukprot:TRINITY_DN871_c0_g1_i13.p1 TRINITY_DN871_c0_g1~~TRINITY_DN871_c0_g1_i13.p1  ORF type:complete len:149 (-),score=36.39 TRINITY_DN871_c0_g1_i13:999-1391(-)
MHKYEIQKEIGCGSYGSVYKSLHKITSQIVAIKQLKKEYHSWDEVKALKEVQAHLKLYHPNITQLKEVIRENSRVFLVFELLEENLHQALKRIDTPFTITRVRSFTYQILKGLSCLHTNALFHRDLKPEN